MITLDEKSGLWRIGDGLPIYETHAQAMRAVGGVLDRKAPNQGKPIPPSTPPAGELKMRARKCRSCKAPILWTFTASNSRRMPVDFEPTPKGNLKLTLDRQGDLISAVVDNKLGGHFYLAHFATCPHRKGWRTRKGKGGGRG